MRLMIIATAIVMVLLMSTAMAQAFALPEGKPFVAGDYGQMPLHGSNRVSVPETYSGNDFSKGLTSVDYLGKARDLTGIGSLSSLFPGTWLAGRASGTPEDSAKYLGFNYIRSGATAPADSLFYTGEQSGGRRIYVSAAGNSSPGMPGLIFLRDGNSYTAYSLSDAPPVYAYVVYGAFNTGESVRFGLVNNGGSSLELMNAAPFEIQRKEGGAWRTAFSPMAAQMILPVQNGTAKEWQWDQRLDDDSTAPSGDYRVLIDGKFAASFRLASDTPAVEKSGKDYDRISAVSVAEGGIQQAFGKSYPAPSKDAREDIISIMQFKALALGLDPAGLRRAVDAAGSDQLPCLAVHARFEGRPAWIIAFSTGAGASAMSGPGVYAVDEETGKVMYRP